jgi:phosphoglycerate dehydrogenase-like enzyme
MPESTTPETTVVVLGNSAEPALGALDALGPGVKIVKGRKADDCASALPEARVLFNWSGSRDEVRKALLAAPRLEWIHARYAGLDKLLFPELVASPVPLTNGVGVFSQSLGEFVILGALYFAKDIPRMLRSKARRKWDEFDVLEVSRQTMGIVGYGDIGRAIARRAKALDMRVYGLRRDPAPRAGDEFVDRVFASSELHSMLPLCDYVVVAAPLTPETKHMISAKEFGLMKPDAIIMNVGRGPVIDEAAMVEALKSKQIRGAALDVFEEEPLPESSPLWDMENVLISPHTADHTKDWLPDAAQFFVEQFGRWRRGEPLKNVVDKQAGY